MKSLDILLPSGIVLAIVAILVQSSASRISEDALIRSECALQEQECRERCNWDAVRAQSDLQFRRTHALLEHLLALRDCRLAPETSGECVAEEERRYEDIVAGLDLQEEQIETRRTACYRTCALERRECEDLRDLEKALARRKLQEEFDEIHRPGEDPVGPDD